MYRRPFSFPWNILYQTWRLTGDGKELKDPGCFATTLFFFEDGGGLRSGFITNSGIVAERTLDNSSGRLLDRYLSAVDNLQRYLSLLKESFDASSLPFSLRENRLADRVLIERRKSLNSQTIDCWPNKLLYHTKAKERDEARGGGECRGE